MKSKVFTAILKSLKTNPFNCSAIDLNQAGLEDRDLLVLTEALKGNTNIHSIDLSHNVKLTEKSLIPFLNGIAALKTLSILKLTGLQWTEKSLNALGNAVGDSPSLKILDLSDTVFTESGLKSLGTGLAHSASLEALYLQNCALNKVAKVLATFLSSCPKSLQKLVLAQNQLNSTVMAWLQPKLACFTHLREFDVSNNVELGSAGAESIAQAALDLSYLTTLNLNEVALEDGLEIFFTALKERSNLHSLSLAGNRLGIKDAFVLQRHLPQYPSLRQLNLGNNPLIEGDGSFSFAEALVKLPYLQDLNLSDTGCNINLHSLMLQLRKMRQLIHLDISHEKLGYSMDLIQLAALLQALPHCPSLRWLNLSFNGLTKNAGIALGQALANQAGLESLDLKGNPLGNQGVHELLKGLQQHPTLQRLSLAKTGLSLLPEVVGEIPLKSLSLNENSLKQESTLVLEKLLKTTITLQQLDLSHNHFNKEGFISFIQSLTQNTTLQMLNVSHIEVDMETALLLKNTFIKHPTLQIVLLNSNSILPSLIEEFEILKAQKHFSTHLPFSTWHLPLYKSNSFIERSSLQNQLANKLSPSWSKNYEKVGIVACCGLGGAGKTSLARDYIHRPYGNPSYSLKAWFNAKYIRNEYIEFAKDLGLILTDEGIDQAIVIQEVKRWLETHPDWLLVYDNASSYSYLESLLPTKGGNILITSRNPDWPQVIEVNPMQSSEAEEMVYQLSGLKRKEPDVSTLVKEEILLHTENLWEAWQIDYEEIKFDKEKLGEGGGGIVCKGTYSNNLVAIKQLKLTHPSSAELAEFKQEMKIMFKLRSPQIVQLYGVYLSPSMGIVMEYMPKGSLYQVLQSKEPLEWSKRYRIAIDMTKGLSFLHKAGIVHKDFKSPNVLINEHWQAKLSDFGIAEFQDKDSLTTNKGSLLWIAPERLRGEKHTKASDVYSLGITLWELSSRELPFKNLKEVDKIKQAIKEGKQAEVLPIPQDCPTQIKKIMPLCWLMEAKNRPTADEVLKQLETPNETEATLLEPGTRDETEVQIALLEPGTRPIQISSSII